MGCTLGWGQQGASCLQSLVLALSWFPPQTQPHGQGARAEQTAPTLTESQGRVWSGSDLTAKTGPNTAVPQSPLRAAQDRALA